MLNLMDLVSVTWFKHCVLWAVADANIEVENQKNTII